MSRTKGTHTHTHIKTTTKPDKKQTNPTKSLQVKIKSSLCVFKNASQKHIDGLIGNDKANTAYNRIIILNPK